MVTVSANGQPAEITPRKTSLVDITPEPVVTNGSESDIIECHDGDVIEHHSPAPLKGEVSPGVPIDDRSPSGSDQWSVEELKKEWGPPLGLPPPPATSSSSTKKPADPKSAPPQRPTSGQFYHSLQCFVSVPEFCLHQLPNQS